MVPDIISSAEEVRKEILNGNSRGSLRLIADPIINTGNSRGAIGVHP